MSAKTKGTKRRRIAVPLGLENVESLSGGDVATVSSIEDDPSAAAAAAKPDDLLDFSQLEKNDDDDDDREDRLPTFLVSALVGEKKKIAHVGCPFEHYVELNQRAWAGEDESEFLIFRSSYDDLVRFVIKQMKLWKRGTRYTRVITGTAGIGKTMFALLLARLCFENNLVVLLYYENVFWAFTEKENRSQFVNELLVDHVTVNETTIYYTFGIDTVDVQNEKLNQLLSLKDIFTIRDCSKLTMEWLGQVVGRIVYFASSGQEPFLETVQNKISIPSHELLKYAKLWSAVECVWATKLGLLYGFGDGSSDVEYVLEGYRRFGGSVRNVLLYARKLKLSGIATDALMAYPLTSYTKAKMRSIIDLQNANQKERAKAKAMVFHRTPVDDGIQCFRTHFASTYLQIEFMKMEDVHKVDILNVVVAALGVSSGKQSAYGTLYEEEFHRAMIEMPASMPQTLHFLGTHEANAKRVKGYIPRREPILDIARSAVLHFPGKSLANARLEPADDPLAVYLHPLTSNFPTHDSFIVCQASDLFEEDLQLTVQDQRRWSNVLANSVVLVGLQQTVSGSDDVEDKPSHTVVGQHLVSHLQDFKSILQQHKPDVNVLDEVVTVFVSPSETCRKVDFMPVLSKDGKPLKNAIAGFPGMAVQYYTVYEVEYIAELVKKPKN